MNLHTLFEHFDNLETFPAGSTIFAEGSSGHVMYIVMEGEVELRKQDKVLEIAGTGRPIGEMALIDASPRSALAIAKSDCRLAPVDEKRFLFMVQQTPFFALQVMRVLADRLRHMDDVLTQNAKTSRSTQDHEKKAGYPMASGQPRTNQEINHNT